MPKKTLQVPVIVGTGSAQFFIENDLTISPPSPPVYMIKEIKKWIEIYNTKVIPGKVIFNAWIWKDINYKTVKHVHDNIVNGPLYHSTTKIPLAGFVPITATTGELVSEDDHAEVLENIIEGEKDHLYDPDTIECETVYKKLHEKLVIRITFKVTRQQDVPVEVDP
jgi:hypothetical protein